MPESDLLPISALQHLLFCERQCALIHIEGLWRENRLTAQGRLLHDKVHESATEQREGVRITRGLELICHRLGLMGVADIVEFHENAAPKPIEYKRGQPKNHDADVVQLCAQALCLEEMLHCEISEGAIFYGKTRRRLTVYFDSSLRAETEAAAARLHALIASGVTPKAQRAPKCDRCSLLDACMPGVLRPRATARRYFDCAVADLLAEH